MKLHPNLFLLNLSLIMIILPTRNYFAQDSPIEWGEIPLADLAMTSFPDDSNASALVLCNYGESFINDDLNITYKRHLRVKILTEKGFDWGTHSITVNPKRDFISDIEAVTYFFDEEGDLVEKELDSDDIFEEKVDDVRKKYWFTLPGLKVGCVIEIQYKIIYEGIWRMPDWVFQYGDPVRWSEYRLKSPAAIAYSIVTTGYEPMYLNEKDELKQHYTGAAASYLGANWSNTNRQRWAVKDAPAVREEPYITTVNDYKTRIDLQLAGYAGRTVGTKKIIQTWESLLEDLLELEDFQGRIKVTSRIRKLAEEITKDVSSPVEKIEAICNWVTKSIVWNNENRMFPKNEVDDVLELKNGSSAESAFLILSLLKSVDITGYPVILSTRTNGRIQEMYPILSQFNCTMVCVIIGTKYYFLDATDRFRTIDLLPEKVLNARGLIIKEGPPMWVTFSTTKKYLQKSLASAELAADGTITGTFENSSEQYGSLSMRRRLNDKEEIDIAKSVFDTEESGFEIDSVTVTGMDSLSDALKLKAWIKSESYAQSNGDFIYVNPHMIHRHKSNPFKSKTREYPVEYNYKSSYTNVVNLIIPDGYKVIESPVNKSFSAAKNSVVFSRKIQSTGNRVTLISRFEVGNTFIHPNYYDELKDFYAKIVSTESEQLVLSAKAETPQQVNENNSTNNPE